MTPTDLSEVTPTDIIEDQLLKIRHDWTPTPLNGLECNRPRISIWAERGNDTEPPHLTLCLNALFAQQTRYLDLQADEARFLAGMLLDCANRLNKLTVAMSEEEK